jgi:hypothetical protein
VASLHGLFAPAELTASVAPQVSVDAHGMMKVMHIISLQGRLGDRQTQGGLDQLRPSDSQQQSQVCAVACVYLSTGCMAIRLSISLRCTAGSVYLLVGFRLFFSRDGSVYILIGWAVPPSVRWSVRPSIIGGHRRCTLPWHRQTDKQTD